MYRTVDSPTTQKSLVSRVDYGIDSLADDVALHHFELHQSTILAGLMHSYQNPLSFGQELMVQSTRTDPSEERAYLAGYDPRAFPPVAVTVDVILFTIRLGRFSVLLVRRGQHPELGKWALPGGFVRPHEQLDEAAARELGEEAGLAQLPPGVRLRQLGAYGSPDRDPRMRVVSVAYLGFAADLPAARAGSDAELARFWPVSDLAGDEAPQIAFDHGQIIRDGVERAREMLENTTLAAAFLEEPFTMADLRAVYEEVWGERIDPSNFRRKVMRQAGFIEPIGRLSPPRSPDGGRPADLYRRGSADRLHKPISRHGDD
jgi:8-oxo-dGTP diphosphatase